jgi:arsenate reductase-like glutaredoxin family protein|tara:strand:+ start:1074 stop:1181 length:108 start_codon:yes stop_codon:yes gene_type:complete
MILGPTGNLRAPSIITGGILIVGFNEETYNSVLNS